MFTDRDHAGRELARALQPWASAHPVVVALPRGGVPLGRHVADALHAPLDVLIVRKLGVPTNPEFAFGALGEFGALVEDEATISAIGISKEQRASVITRAQEEIDRRVMAYRGGRPLTSVSGRTVIVIDDGLATGATAAAAVAVVRHLGATRVVLGVPTGSRQAVDRLASISDDVVCVDIPTRFSSVGAQYEHFPQVTDSEVVDALAGSR